MKSYAQYANLWAGVSAETQPSNELGKEEETRRDKGKGKQPLTTESPGVSEEEVTWKDKGKERLTLIIDSDQPNLNVSPIEEFKGARSPRSANANSRASEPPSSPAHLMHKKLSEVSMHSVLSHGEDTPTKRSSEVTPRTLDNASRMRTFRNYSSSEMIKVQSEYISLGPGSPTESTSISSPESVPSDPSPSQDIPNTSRLTDKTDTFDVVSATSDYYSDGPSIDGSSYSSPFRVKASGAGSESGGVFSSPRDTPRSSNATPRGSHERSRAMQLYSPRMARKKQSVARGRAGSLDSLKAKDSKGTNQDPQPCSSLEKRAPPFTFKTPSPNTESIQPKSNHPEHNGPAPGTQTRRPKEGEARLSQSQPTSPAIALSESRPSADVDFQLGQTQKSDSIRAYPPSLPKAGADLEGPNTILGTMMMASDPIHTSLSELAVSPPSPGPSLGKFPGGASSPLLPTFCVRKPSQDTQAESLSKTESPIKPFPGGDVMSEDGAQEVQALIRSSPDFRPKDSEGERIRPQDSEGIRPRDSEGVRPSVIGSPTSANTVLSRRLIAKSKSDPEMQPYQDLHVDMNSPHHSNHSPSSGGSEEVTSSLVLHPKIDLTRQSSHHLSRKKGSSFRLIFQLDGQPRRYSTSPPRRPSDTSDECDIRLSPRVSSRRGTASPIRSLPLYDPDQPMKYLTPTPDRARLSPHSATTLKSVGNRARKTSCPTCPSTKLHMDQEGMAELQGDIRHRTLCPVLEADPDSEKPLKKALSNPDLKRGRRSRSKNRRSSDPTCSTRLKNRSMNRFNRRLSKDSSGGASSGAAPGQGVKLYYRLDGSNSGSSRGVVSDGESPVTNRSNQGRSPRGRRATSPTNISLPGHAHRTSASPHSHGSPAPRSPNRLVYRMDGRSKSVDRSSFLGKGKTRLRQSTSPDHRRSIPYSPELNRSGDPSFMDGDRVTATRLKRQSPKRLRQAPCSSPESENGKGFTHMKNEGRPNQLSHVANPNSGDHETSEESETYRASFVFPAQNGLIDLGRSFNSSDGNVAPYSPGLPYSLGVPWHTILEDAEIHARASTIEAEADHRELLQHLHTTISDQFQHTRASANADIKQISPPPNTEVQQTLLLANTEVKQTLPPENQADIAGAIHTSKPEVTTATKDGVYVTTLQAHPTPDGRATPSWTYYIPHPDHDTQEDKDIMRTISTYLYKAASLIQACCRVKLVWNSLYARVGIIPRLHPLSRDPISGLGLIQQFCRARLSIQVTTPLALKRRARLHRATIRTLLTRTMVLEERLKFPNSPPSSSIPTHSRTSHTLSSIHLSPSPFPQPQLDPYSNPPQPYATPSRTHPLASHLDPHSISPFGFPKSELWSPIPTAYNPPGLSTSPHAHGHSRLSRTRTPEPTHHRLHREFGPLFLNRHNATMSPIAAPTHASTGQLVGKRFLPPADAASLAAFRHSPKLFHSPKG